MFSTENVLSKLVSTKIDEKQLQDCQSIEITKDDHDSSNGDNGVNNIHAPTETTEYVNLPSGKVGKPLEGLVNAIEKDVIKNPRHIAEIHESATHQDERYGADEDDNDIKIVSRTISVTDSVRSAEERRSVEMKKTVLTVSPDLEMDHNTSTVSLMTYDNKATRGKLNVALVRWCRTFAMDHSRSIIRAAATITLTAIIRPLIIRPLMPRGKKRAA